MSADIDLKPEDVRGYVDYLRDLGIFDLYAGSTPADAAVQAWYSTLTAKHANSTAPAAQRNFREPHPPPTAPAAPAVTPFQRSMQRSGPPRPPAVPAAPRVASGPQVIISASAAPADVHTAARHEDDGRAESMEAAGHDIFAEAMPPVPFNQLAPLPVLRVPSSGKAAALESLRNTIGDCTRCPLAYAGRHSIVFGDGDPGARLMFVGEGPGADEDETGVPFVGKAGQLLNNMIAAMGLQREAVYIANIVKCRPPKNRVPEPVEANTCSQFLLQQIDIVQPDVIVALGSTAATYLLGVKQSLSTLRGQWFDVRGAKCAVTYHPAYLLRDPRQKGEAWKDLQRVMVEMKLTPPARG